MEVLMYSFPILVLFWLPLWFIHPTSRDTKKHNISKEKGGGTCYSISPLIVFLKIFVEGHVELHTASGASLKVNTLAEDQNGELLDCFFWQKLPHSEPDQELLTYNYIKFHCCEKATPTNGGDVSMCE